MGFIGALAGYATGKAAVAVLALSLYAGGVGAALISPVFPPAAVVSAGLFCAADAAGAMLVSPIDPISTATTTVVGAGTGPV